MTELPQDLIATTIVDTMNDNPQFALAVYMALAEKIQSGSVRDQIFNSVQGMEVGQVSFLAGSFEDLGRAIREGFNSASLYQQI